MFWSGLVCVCLGWAGLANLAQFGKPAQVDCSEDSVMEVCNVRFIVRAAENAWHLFYAVLGSICHVLFVWGLSWRVLGLNLISVFNFGCLSFCFRLLSQI